MELTGICDVINYWRIQNAVRKNYDIYTASPEAEKYMEASGIAVKGGMAELLSTVELVVDCTSKEVAANVEQYNEQGIKFIVQGGEKHETTDIYSEPKIITNQL